MVPGGPQPRALSNGPQMAAAAAGAQPRGPSAQAPPAYKYQAAMRTPGMQPGGQPSGIVSQGQEPLSATVLASAHPNDQKQMLGERLFPLIHVSLAIHTSPTLIEQM